MFGYVNYVIKRLCCQRFCLGVGKYENTMHISNPSKKEGIIYNICMDLYIIGNGLAIDLRASHMDALRNWDTSRPLSWDIDVAGKPAIDYLPLLRSALIKARDQSSDDFTIISIVANEADKCIIKNTIDDDFRRAVRLRAELAAYLCKAFSAYDAVVRKIDIVSWHWGQYLSLNGKEALMAVSFNYDLTFERILKRLGLSYFALGVEETATGVYVGKPHGSIDYEVNPSDISMPTHFPPQNSVTFNNTSLVRISDEGIDNPRKQCELVAPSSGTMIRRFQWVAPIFTYIRENQNKISRCVILGHSYRQVDRQEIDEILGSLVAGTKIVVANPYLDKDLASVINAKGLILEHWSSGPV